MNQCRGFATACWVEEISIDRLLLLGSYEVKQVAGREMMWTVERGCQIRVGAFFSCHLTDADDFYRLRGGILGSFRIRLTFFLSDSCTNERSELSTTLGHSQLPYQSITSIDSFPSISFRYAFVTTLSGGCIYPVSFFLAVSRGSIGVAHVIWSHMGIVLYVLEWKSLDDAASVSCMPFLGGQDGRNWGSATTRPSGNRITRTRLESEIAPSSHLAV
jgi:porphobilinogen deaminase